MMIRLGHIDYSNCIPVHALLLEAGHEDVRLVHGVPTQLNDALARGDIDVAPCSSIEYARHAGAYRILPGFAIGSAGPVRSILLETTRPVAALGGATIAVPSASATSIVLLRILLELRSGVRARLEAFDQAAAVDPVEHGAAAVLRIGDVALARRVPAGRSIIDLGALWYEWTGLPFAFAVWQVRAGVAPADTTRLLQLLTRSRAWFHEHERELAQRHAPGFGLEPATLLDYWRSLHFDLDAPMRRGLLHFFGLAAELGAAPPTTSLDIIAA
jgi:chorismate dehydratase